MLYAASSPEATKPDIPLSAPAPSISVISALAVVVAVIAAAVMLLSSLENSSALQRVGIQLSLNQSRSEEERPSLIRCNVVLLRKVALAIEVTSLHAVFSALGEAKRLARLRIRCRECELAARREDSKLTDS